MRLLIQRVSRASVTIGGELRSQIGHGLLIFVGIEHEDTAEDCRWLAAKAAALRIFDDANGVMNLNVRQAEGETLAVSQFTLHASTRKGNRPSYIRAAKEDVAVPLYEEFILQLSSQTGRLVGSGVFGADMQVELINDGPVTIWIDSRSRD